jgi:sec-independent protein translocase protein TatB
MFGIGLPEMIVILAVALIVVGPDKLPELARSLAKGVQELKKTVNQVKENLNEEGNVLNDVQKTVNQVKEDLGKDGNLLGDVHNDLQKTAEEFQNHVLDSTSDTWHASSEDEQQENDNEVIDLQPLQERPWEKDRQKEPHEETASGDAEITPPVEGKEEEIATATLTDKPQNPTT